MMRYDLGQSGTMAALGAGVMTPADPAAITPVTGPE